MLVGEQIFTFLFLCWRKHFNSVVCFIQILEDRYGKISDRL